MKKIIIILLVLVSSISIVKAKHLFEITSNLTSIKYISESEIIACGENGTILKSIDGGETWKYINSNTQVNLTDIDYLKSNNNYVVISGGNTLLFSKNEGEVYTKLQFDTNQIISSLFIYNEQTLIAGTFKGKLNFSNNTGQTWNELSISNKRISDIFLFNKVVYCFDDNNQYYKIDIESQTFTKTQKPSNYFLRKKDTYFFDDNIGVKANGDIRRTINGGINWDVVYNDSISNYRTIDNLFFALDFENGKNGIAVGRYNTIFKTNDGGLSWELKSNFTNFLASIKINVFENGEEDIVYFTADRFTVFKSTNSGTTFQPTSLFRDSTFRFARASPVDFFDSNTCIYYSNQDQALFKSTNAGKTFINHIPLDTNDTFNPFKYLNGYDDTFNNSRSHQMNENELYFYRSQVQEENGIQCKSTNFVYFSLDKGNSWNGKIIPNNMFSSLNTSQMDDFIYAGGFFIDSLKSVEQGYLSFSAGVLKFNKKFEIVQEIKFPDYLLIRSINFINEKKGYALLLDKQYKSNLFFTEDGGKIWSKILSALDSMYYLSEMTVSDNKLILTQTYDEFNNKYQTKVLILDLITLDLEILEIDNTPIAVYSPTNITKNYIYFNGLQNNETLFKSRKIFRLKRSELISSIEEYNVENNNIATVWLSNSGANPFTSQTEFTATWLPNTDLNSVTIKIYDLNGIEVADLTNQLINKQFNSNQSKIEFAPNNLPSGIYLPVISDKTFRKSISIIYIK